MKLISASNKLVPLLALLVSNDVESFTVRDDRGGSGGWQVETAGPLSLNLIVDFETSFAGGGVDIVEEF